MNRVKFVVFALVAVGLWLANLSFLAPALSARAVEQATKQAAVAPTAVALKIEGRRIELQRALLRVAGSPVALSSLKAAAKLEAPNAERLAPVKAAVAEALPEGLRGAAIVGLSNEAGVIWARGDEAPSSSAEVLDLAKLASAGADGAAHPVMGASHLFFSVPVVSISDRAEARSLGTIVIGAPELPEGVAESIATDLRLAAVAIAEDGKRVQSGGVEKAQAELVEKAVKLGESGIIARGKLGTTGPVALPMGTSDDPMGGNAPLAVGLHQAIGASRYQVIASVSLAPFMQTLADYQHAALLALAGLLALSGAFALLIGGSAPKLEEPEVVQPAPERPARAAASAKAEEPEESTEPAPDEPPEIPDHSGGPEASPDDFQFGPPAPPSEPSAEGLDFSGVPANPEPQAEIFGGSEDEPAPNPFGEASPEGSSGSDFDQAFPPDPEGEGYPSFESLEPPNPGLATTRPMPAYSGQAETPFQPDADPFGQSSPFGQGGDAFALASAQGGGFDSMEAYGEENPEATRVAVIPQELLQASARPAAADPMVAAPRVVQPLPKVPAMSVQTAVVSPDEQHFQDVYRDFVATRERCGEPGDGLTFEKFALKLKKNREQLIAKHSCRTVRFQVYVKEGKAALKATPIKE